jgi:hypothetical protein
MLLLRRKPLPSLREVRQTEADDKAHNYSRGSLDNVQPPPAIRS